MEFRVDLMKNIEKLNEISMNKIMNEKLNERKNQYEKLLFLQ